MKLCKLNVSFILFVISQDETNDANIKKFRREEINKDVYLKPYGKDGKRNIDLGLALQVPCSD